MKYVILTACAVLVMLASLGLVHELDAPPRIVTSEQTPPPARTSAPHIARAGALEQPVQALPEELVPRTPILVTPLATQPASPPSYPDSTPPPDFRSR